MPGGARTFDAKGSDTLVYSIEGILYFVRLVPKLGKVTKLQYAKHIEDTPVITYQSAPAFRYSFVSDDARISTVSSPKHTWVRRL